MGACNEGGDATFASDVGKDLVLCPLVSLIKIFVIFGRLVVAEA